MKLALLGLEAPQVGGAFSAEMQVLNLMQTMTNEELEVTTEKDLGITRNIFWKFQGLMLNYRAPHFLNKIKSLINIQPLSSLERKLKKHDVDFVIFLSPSQEFLRLTKTPFAYTIWDFGQQDLRGFPEIYERNESEKRFQLNSLASRRANFIITDCDSNVERIATEYHFPLERIVKIAFLPNSRFAEIPKPISTEPVALYPAHFWAHKNHRILIDALNWNKSRGVSSKKLVFTGQDKGYMKQVQAYVESLKLSDQVVFKGFIGFDELLELIGAADILVMPSLLGPTNIPPLEALAAGTPVAVTEGAAENLPFIAGVSVLSGDNYFEWARFLERDNQINRLDGELVQSHFNQIMVENNSEVIRLLSEVKSLLYFTKF
jgi:glycosyltransferase involved in cell wall biosynthesis